MTKKQHNKLSKARALRKGADIALTNLQLQGSGFLDFLKPVGRVFKPVADIAVDVAKPIVTDMARTAITGALTGKGRKAPKKGGNPFLASMLAPIAVNAVRGVLGFGAKRKGRGIADKVRSVANRAVDLAKPYVEEGLEMAKPVARRLIGQAREKVGDVLHDTLDNVLEDPMSAVRSVRRAVGFGKKRKGGSFLPAGY